MEPNFELEAALQHGKTADAEIERLTSELEYAYRCIDHGYKFGTFDFSVLRQRASEWLADKDGGVEPRRNLLIGR